MSQVMSKLMKRNLTDAVQFIDRNRVVIRVILHYDDRVTTVPRRWRVVKSTVNKIITSKIRAGLPSDFKYQHNNWICLMQWWLLNGNREIENLIFELCVHLINMYIVGIRSIMNVIFKIIFWIKFYLLHWSTGIPWHIHLVRRHLEKAAQLTLHNNMCLKEISVRIQEIDNWLLLLRSAAAQIA